jgi:hypothetical protein
MQNQSDLRKFRIQIKLPSHNIYYYYDSRREFVKDQELLKTKYDKVTGYVLIEGTYNRIT